MVDVQTETVINQPLTKVVAYASDPDHTPHWYVNIKSIEWKSPKPLVVGSLLAFKARFLGRDLAYIYEVTELSSNKMVMKTADGPFPMETTYTWESLSENETKMTLRNRGNPTGFSKLMAPLMAPAMKRATAKDLALLKKILEND